MSEREIAVKVQDLTKSFKIPLEASSGIKQKLINTLKGRKGYRDFTPLNDISFEIEKGDFFGIVGRNGSGKSTLLKTIAGIYTPTKGAVHISGTLIPFIELGVGFNPELTGRENVFLNGALLGFSHDEMEAMYDDIVEFAELEDFMDERLKNYSSGMQVRLAFSIAIRAQGDILLLDEVLAVGDEAFQKKCFQYFESLKNSGSTVILVTHDMGAVQKFCTKAMLINSGNIEAVGDPYEIAAKYTTLNQDVLKKEKAAISEKYPQLGENAKVSSVSRIDDKVETSDTIKLAITISSSIEEIVTSVSIVRTDNIYIAGSNSSCTLSISKGNSIIYCDICTKDLLTGNYFINVSLYNKNFDLMDFESRAVYFGIRKQLKDYDGIMLLPVTWDYE